LLGNPSVRPEDERQGSIALTQEQTIDAADGQPDLQLSWDGSNGHNHGYYWTYQYPGSVSHPNDSADLGALAGYGATLHYKYFIANVSDSDQTYISTVTVSGRNHARGWIAGSPSVAAAILPGGSCASTVSNRRFRSVGTTGGANDQNEGALSASTRPPTILATSSDTSSTERAFLPKISLTLGLRPPWPG